MNPKRTVYENPWLRVDEHRVVESGGKTGIYGVATMPRAAGCVPIDTYGYTWLVGQYRFPIDAWSWKVPSGCLEPGEDVVQGARRELRKETGLLASRITPLGQVYTNSYSNGQIDFFLAQDLEEGEPVFDSTEQLVVKKILFQDAVAMVMDGRITDAPTMAMLLKADAMDVVRPRIRILYQDDFCVAIHKPAGLLVHRTKDAADRVFLVQRLRDQLERKVWPIHRLDRSTSGVMLFAFSAKTASSFACLFSERQVDKTYLALVRGYTDDSGVIDQPVKSQTDKQEKAAVTHYQTVDRVEVPLAVGRYEKARYSLVRVRIETGRTHQIRRHFAHIRHPVIGDSTYGDNKHNALFKHRFLSTRILLLSETLGFEHPFTDQPMKIRTEPDPEFGHVLKLLGFAVPLSGAFAIFK